MTVKTLPKTDYSSKLGRPSLLLSGPPRDFWSIHRRVERLFREWAMCQDSAPEELCAEFEEAIKTASNTSQVIALCGYRKLISSNPELKVTLYGRVKDFARIFGPGEVLKRQAFLDSVRVRLEKKKKKESPYPDRKSRFFGPLKLPKA